ncbi:MAG: family 20 glycosylhydrolase [Bacteroidaceae bacterium]|nr:family 20 glycosylhydrolase [Bacteroidaceae bacterium]
MKKTFLLVLMTIGLLFATPVSANTDKNEKPFVIPELKEWKAGAGTFQVTAETRIVYPKKSQELKAVAQHLSNDYKEMFGLEIPVIEGSAKSGDIALQLKKDKKLGEEGYQINISNKVVISAPTARGAYWATRTILQMSEQSEEHALVKGTIRDWPDYAVRGFMLDVARKYVPIHFVSDYVKFMAYYKMNTFQIHLNDNGFKQYFNHDWNKTPSAFRLESEYFPNLTARDGYYTKKEFIELQKMAESIYVDIIPEIDVPAHSLAFSKFRPEIASKDYGMDHLDLFKDETYQFVDSLFDEYLKGDEPVFRGKRVNVGTDEYSNRDKAVVEKFRYFTDHCIRLVEKYGKQAVAWGALTHANGETPVKSENVILTAWHNPYAQPDEMMKQGYDLISIPDGWLYIVPAAGYYYDYLNCHHLYHNWTPAQIGDKKFDECHPQILGGMFAVWNDHAGNGISTKDIHYRVFPAMQTMAVKMWTGASPKTPYEEFDKARLNLSDAPGVNIAGRFKGENKLVYASKEVKPGSESGIDEIGFKYNVTFDIVAAKEERGTKLFSSRDADFYLCDPVQSKIGFSRDGYLNTFNYSFFPGEKATVTITGDQNVTSLYINGKLIETLNKQTLYFNEGGKDKMYYVRTLVFPLEKAGNFKSKITNLKVTNSLDGTVK